QPGPYNSGPALLAWRLSHSDAQRYLAACCQGSVAPSITKSQLGSLPIMVPAIERQKRMVKLADAAIREMKLYQKLIDNRQRMIDDVGQQLLRPDTTTEY